MHIPSLEGVYQTLTKQQEIIYKLSGKLKLLKSKLGICDDVNKQKNSKINATMESLSDSIISMSLVDQVQNERPKMSEKKLKDLRNYLSNRPVVNITPQRPKLPGLNSEIILEKRTTAIRNLKKRSETGAIQKPVPTLAPIPQNTTKPPTSESVFNVGQIHAQKSAPAPQNQSIQQLLSKKSEEPAKPTSSFSFGAPPQASFGSTQPSFGSTQPAFGSTQPSFGTAPQATPFGLNLSGNSQPSFGLSSTPVKFQ